MPLDSSITPHIDGVGRIMITQGGAHPPEFWAQVTAEQIAPIADSMTGAHRIQALILQAKLAEVLETHHRAVQDANPTEVNPAPFLDDAVRDVVAAAQESEWSDHFNAPDVQAQIRMEIGRHFADAQHIAIRTKN